jgi:hypothetical protein
MGPVGCLAMFYDPMLHNSWTLNFYELVYISVNFYTKGNLERTKNINILTSNQYQLRSIESTCRGTLAGHSKSEKFAVIGP